MPTFVEVKRASDTRSRREVVAQMLDYAANATAYWDASRLQTWFEEKGEGAGREPEERLAEVLKYQGDYEEFWALVQTNLKAPRVRCIFVADVIPPSLRRLVEFLNEQMRSVDVFAVEIPQYVGKDGLKALVPRLVGQTARAQAQKEGAPRAAQRAQPWAVEDVLGLIAGADAKAGALAGRFVEWVRSREHGSLRGGAGLSQPALLAEADTGRSRSRVRVFSALFCDAEGGHPTLVVRLKRMRRTPPWNQRDRTAELDRRLLALDVPRLAGGPQTWGERPRIPLAELTAEKLDVLIGIYNDWIDEVRAKAGVPEESDGEEVD